MGAVLGRQMQLGSWIAPFQLSGIQCPQGAFPNSAPPAVLINVCPEAAWKPRHLALAGCIASATFADLKRCATDIRGKGRAPELSRYRG